MSEIQYWEPIHKAWDKMVTVLFRPFDLSKWMVIGFCAFLANCGREGGGSGNFNSGNHSSGGEDWSKLSDCCVDAWAEYSQWIIFGGCLIVFLIVAMTILVNWLNSRGQFMLLDNVLKNRGAVSEPWSVYRKEANSLMVFQVVIELVSLVIVLVLLAGFLVPLIVMISAHEFIGGWFCVAMISILLLVIFSVAFGFLRMVLSHFVVPLMYQRKLSVCAGFEAFSPVLKTNFWRIVLFGLVMWLVNISIGIAILIGGFLTCCTAFLVMLIPYIGTVLVLPVFVFRRFIGVEFLKQFGSTYDLLGSWDAPGEEPVLLPPVDGPIEG